MNKQEERGTTKKAHKNIQTNTNTITAVEKMAELAVWEAAE